MRSPVDGGNAAAACENGASSRAPARPSRARGVAVAATVAGLAGSVLWEGAALAGEARVNLDLIVRRAHVVTAGDTFDADLGIHGGRVVAIGERLVGGPVTREIDAAGRLVTSTSRCRRRCAWPTASRAARAARPAAARPR
jgi:hypothetical protein